MEGSFMNCKNRNEIIKIIIIPGKHEVSELQKTAVLGTAHIFWKVLM